MLRSQIMSIAKSLNQAIFNSFQTNGKIIFEYTYVGTHNTSLYQITIKN